MKRKILFFTLAIITVVCITTATVNAETHSGQCGDNLTWTFDTETGVLEITGTGDMYAFKKLGDAPWHSFREAIKSINIGDKVTSIEYCAFRDCSDLKNIVIPSGVTLIDELAFSACDSLTGITVDEANTMYSSDEFGVLFNKNKSTLIHYPAGNTRTEYNIPANVTKIVKQTLSYCPYLTSITVDAANEAYSHDKFGVLFNKNKSALVQYPRANTRTEYNIPSGVASIEFSAFAECEYLTTVIIPEGVVSIGFYAFSECDRLKSIVIPDTVTSIHSCAFQECNSLTSVFVSSGVTLIQELAFNGCDSLTSITVDEANSAYSSDKYGVLFNKDKTTLIQYPSGNTRKWYSIPNGVTSIDYAAFVQCNNLTSIVIPDGVTSISFGTFSSCHNLKSITIPATVTNIESSALPERRELTVYGYTGSKAESYVKYNRKITFVALTGPIQIPGDINEDGVVTELDFTLLLLQFVRRFVRLNV